MGTVAKSSITLVSISDAYSLSLTPNSCVIKADFDGSNPKLEHAYTIISAYCGDEKTPIEIDSSTIIKSNDNIECQLIKVDSYRYRLSIISLPVDILQGYIEIPVLSHFLLYAKVPCWIGFKIGKTIKQLLALLM